jgi:hypothetical protein
MCAGGVILTLSFVGFFSCTDRVHLLGQGLSWLLSAPAAPCQFQTFATTATAAPPAAGHPQTAPAGLVGASQTLANASCSASAPRAAAAQRPQLRLLRFGNFHPVVCPVGSSASQLCPVPRWLACSPTSSGKCALCMCHDCSGLFISGCAGPPACVWSGITRTGASSVLHFDVRRTSLHVCDERDEL